MDAYLSSNDGGRLEITVRGEIDLANAGDLLKQLDALAGPAAARIALDLSRVVFIDCAALHALVDLERRVHARGASVRVAASSPAVNRLFELLGPLAAHPHPAAPRDPACAKDRSSLDSVAMPARALAHGPCQGDAGQPEPVRARTLPERRSGRTTEEGTHLVQGPARAQSAAGPTLVPVAAGAAVDDARAQPARPFTDRDSAGPQVSGRAALNGNPKAVAGAVDDLDEALRRVAIGQHSAFERVYGELAGAIYGLACRMLRDRVEAEQVAQEVLLEVWRTAGRFDRSRGSARAWVMAIAHRRTVDRVRAHRAAPDREAGLARASLEAPLGEDAPTAQHIVERSRLDEILGGLSEPQRETFMLAYFDGYTSQQVADLQGSPPGTVKTQMRDGMSRVRGHGQIPRGASQGGASEGRPSSDVQRTRN